MNNFTGPDDPRIVDAIIARMDALTKDEILELLGWTPGAPETAKVLVTSKRRVLARKQPRSVGTVTRAVPRTKRAG